MKPVREHIVERIKQAELALHRAHREVRIAHQFATLEEKQAGAIAGSEAWSAELRTQLNANERQEP